MQVAQLQEALVRLERERDAVSAELLQALARIRSLESAAVDAHRAGGEGQQLQEQVDLAMEVLGERNARVRCALLTNHLAPVRCALPLQKNELRWHAQHTSSAALPGVL